MSYRSAALFLAACLPSLAPSLVIAQTPVPQLLSQLARTQRVGAVAIAPDGKTVAADLPEGLVLSDLDGHNKRTLAACPANDGRSSELAWSPDGSRHAALADCGGTLEITETGIAPGSKPRVLTGLHGFAKGLAYAPDGRSVAVLYVEGASRPSGALAAEKPRTGVIGVEGLEIQRVAVVDTATGALRQVTPPDLHVFEFDYSPHADQLAFVAAAPPGENNWRIARLYTEPVAGGTPKAILDPNTVSGPLHGLQIAVPRWSPDGSKIALIGGLMSDQGATGGDLYLLPSDGSAEPINFTPNSTTTLQWIQWLPDGQLLATAVRGGAPEVDRLSFTFGPGFHAPAGTRVGVTNRLTSRTLVSPNETFGDGRLEGSFAVSRDGSAAAWSASGFDAPPELHAGPLNGQPLPAITQLNAGLKPAWGKSESVEWTNEGFHVQGWLLYPANYDPARKYGLIVLVHGGPSSSVEPRWSGAGFGAAPLSAAGYFVLQPNPRGSYGQGEAFTQANRKDFGYGDLRDILAGVDAVEHRVSSVDDNRLGLTGWSYGGFMTMFGITQTHRFKAAVAGAGISDWLSYYGENQIDQWMTPFFGASVYNDPAVYAKSSAINYVKNVTTPTLIVVGDRDGECPAPQSFELWHALNAFHVPTTLVVYPDEGHGFSNPQHRIDVLERSINWFNQYLR